MVRLSRVELICSLVAIVCLAVAITFAAVKLTDGGAVHGLPTSSARISSDEESRLCLEPLLRRPGPERREMLEVAEEAIASGGSEPDPGTCGAERLEWLRGEL